MSKLAKAKGGQRELRIIAGRWRSRRVRFWMCRA